MNFNAPRPPSFNGKSAAGYFANHWWLIIAIACLALVTLAFSPFAGLRSKAAVNNKTATTDKATTATSTSSVSTGKAARQTVTSSSDGIWEKTGEKNLSAAQADQAKVQAKYISLRLNKQSLAGVLATAPLQNSSDARFRAVTLSLPLPDGTFGTFRILDSPIIEPALAARHPEIKTYKGVGVDDPTASTRFSWTPNGFEAIILSGSGTTYIVPAVQGNSVDHVCYSVRDVATEGDMFHCDAEGISGVESRDSLVGSISGPNSSVGTNSPTAGTALRTFRLAIATTAEFTQQFGAGSPANTLNSIVSTVSSINAIYERDLAIKLILVDHEDRIIYTNASNDPYDNSNVGALLSANQGVIDGEIGSANYDIGHVFGGISVTNGYRFSGIATIGVVCDNANKARGATALGDSSALVRSQLVGGIAHEMGHQFGAHHTFNATTNSFCASQRSPDHAYEPGSGSTLMAYSLCSSGGVTENLQPADDNYFHAHSTEEILTYVATKASCAISTPSGNSPPAISTGSNFTIPANTPFALTVTATDPDGDGLTYDWEEYDLAGNNSGPPNTDDGIRPIFRSYSPDVIPTRYFPSMYYVRNFANVPPLFTLISGINYLTGESLPTTNRTMNFRATVRDNHLPSGGTETASTAVTVIAAAGPFAVTQPNSNVSWPGGSQQTVTWNVAGSTGSGINTANVKISLSTNGGLTFPTVLATSVPNIGSALVTLPALVEEITSARIKIEAVGNIFFDISDVNFTMTANVGRSSFQFSSFFATGTEASGIATIIVTRTGDTTGAATVDYQTSDGSATQVGDYEIGSGTLAFAPGQTQKTFTLLINQDSIVDPNESFNLALLNATGAGAIVGTPGNAWVTIIDDDTSNQSAVTKLFVGDLSGSSVAPATSSTGRAAAVVELSQDEATASVSLTFTSQLGSNEASAGIFGPAAPGSNGPLVFSLPLGDFRDTQVLLSTDNVTQLKSGLYYIGIQTASSPGGEIRGQLLANPMDDAQAFIQQHYIDFLARVPDGPGLDFWTKQITVAGTDPIQLRNKRVDASNAFFFEQEYQQTGAYVFRLYRAAFGNDQPFHNTNQSLPQNLTEAKKLPSYLVFSNDRARVVGGASLPAGQLDLAQQFVARQTFIDKYSPLWDAGGFVDQILLNIKNDSGADLTSQRAALINLYNTGGRGLVLYRLADDNTNNPIDNHAFIDAEYNRAFVATQYFGYLRREPDMGGFLFWLDQVNRASLRDVPRQHAMVCSFITSGEYQARFSTVISRFNSECPQ